MPHEGRTALITWFIGRAVLSRVRPCQPGRCLVRRSGSIIRGKMRSTMLAAWYGRSYGAGVSKVDDWREGRAERMQVHESMIFDWRFVASLRHNLLVKRACASYAGWSAY